MPPNTLFERVKEIALSQRGWTKWKNNAISVELNSNDYDPETGLFYNYEALLLRCEGKKIWLEVHDEGNHLSTITWDTETLQRVWENYATKQQFKGTFSSFSELEANLMDKIKTRH